MLGNRQSIASLQSDFYRLKFHKILRWLLFSVCIIFMLIAAIVYLLLFVQPETYYANTTSGKILNMPPAKASA